MILKGEYFQQANSLKKTYHTLILAGVTKVFDYSLPLDLAHIAPVA